jgi:hypothetical protein
MKSIYTILLTRVAHTSTFAQVEKATDQAAFKGMNNAILISSS